MSDGVIDSVSEAAKSQLNHVSLSTEHRGHRGHSTSLSFYYLAISLVSQQGLNVLLKAKRKDMQTF